MAARMSEGLAIAQARDTAQAADAVQSVDTAQAVATAQAADTAQAVDNRTNGSDADACFLVEVESIDLEGRGVARRAGKVIFLDQGLPGERIVARTTKRGTRFDRAQAVEIRRASSARVNPRCPHFGICGGCSMQHIDGPSQIAIKQRVLEDQLWHLARIRPDHILAPVAGGAWNYRRRARLSVRHVLRKGSVLVGFHERSSRYVADMLECHVMSQRVSALLPELRSVVASLSIRDKVPQIEVSEGDPAMLGSEHAALQAAPSTLALVFRVLASPDEDDLERLRAFAATHALELWLQPQGPDSARLLHPERSQLGYTLQEFGLRMDFLPTDFTQVNHAMNAVMVSQAVAHLDLKADDRVIDLFSGLGNFSLPIARHAREVLGVELNDSLTLRARGLADRHALGSVARFLTANLFAMPFSAWEALGPFSKAVIDPPREGAQQVCTYLAQQTLSPARIVYLSCNPATLARDAAILVHQGPYRLRSAGVMNMFPHTSHVESMAVFDKTKDPA